MRYIKFKNIMITNKGPYLLSGISNIETGSATKRKIKYIDADGVSYRDITYNERPFEISGYILADSEEEMVERKRKLIQACSLKDSVTVEYFNRRNRYKAECYFDRLPAFSARNKWNLPFKLFLSIPGFYWLSYFKKNIKLYYHEDTCTDEFTLPCIFTKRVDTEIEVHNAGDCECDAIFEITNESDSVEQTVIENVETGEKIIINHKLQKGEVVTVDTEKNTVTSSIFGNITPKISIDTEFFKIKNGKNVVCCKSLGNFTKLSFYERFFGV